MTRRPIAHTLSRRERHVMDVLYRLGRATVAEVLAELPSPPSYSAVRATMRIMEEKGHLRHIVDGPRFVFETVRHRDTESRWALRHVVRTFFNDSTEDAIAALLESADQKLSKETLDQLARRIEAARQEGR